MVKISSIPNEYYLGDLPGNIQYSKDPQEILDTNLPEDDNNCGFIFCEQSYQNLRRLTPLSKAQTNWKILLMMRRETAEGEIWLKGALLDKDTGKIALLTATNTKENIEIHGSRPVKTVDGSWYVGHYRMSAPIIFWKELKNRLLY